tara:strand:- start:940 stop:1644 length:705 start_codon:yes stop_codon:yes gene_type:complete
MSNYKLIGVGTNAKTIKGDGSEYLTAILYMKPGGSLCPMSKIAGCEGPCLYKAGRGAMNCVQASRTRKAELYRNNRQLFNETLVKDLTKFQNYCIKRDITPVVRLNGTSDILFLDIIEQFPRITFYDYTKVVNRVRKDLPTNYHITLSYSEANKDYAMDVINHAYEHNVNMAVVFRNPEHIPTTFYGMPVIDGDKDDLRFLDPSNGPHVVALYAKGPAKKDTSGFVIDTFKGVA